MEFRQLLAYRLVFWTSFFGTTVGHFVVGFFMWNAIYNFRNVQTIRGSGQTH
jgi:hypothetical protein